jgi:hypothetical protein
VELVAVRRKRAKACNDVEPAASKLSDHVKCLLTAKIVKSATLIRAVDRAER